MRAAENETGKMDDLCEKPDSKDSACFKSQRIVSSSPQSSFHSNEAGVVLSLTPAIIVVAIIFIFFGIGASQFQRFISLQDSAARLAGSAALRAVSIANAAGNNMSAALQSAANKAVEDAYSNSPNLFTVGLDSINLSVFPQVNGTHGVVTAGTWHYIPPATCVAVPGTCPCNGGSWAGPCFEPHNTVDATMNAVRVELKTRTGNPFTTGVSVILNALQLPMRTEAITAARAISAVSLLDLSRSSHNETHVPYDGDVANLGALGYAAESTFEMSSGACGASNANPCVRIPPPPIPAPTTPLCTANCQMVGPPFPENDPILNPYNVLWNSPCRPTPPATLITYRFLVNKTGGNAMTDGRRPGTLFSPQYHFQNDYQCFPATFTEASGTARSANYLVDTWQGATTLGSYDGPEPYTTMLSAVSGGITALTERAWMGDRLGFIGFDKSATVVERTVTPSPTSALTDLFEATDITNQSAAALLKRYTQFNLMIRPDGSTNLPSALMQAHQMLSSYSDDFERIVVVVSDGIANCTAEGVCGGTQADYDAAMTQAEAIVQSLYIPAHIKLYWVHIGARSRPHNLLIKSSDTPTTCMEQEEADNHAPPMKFVDDATTSTFPSSILATTNDFYNPLRFYNLIRLTRGKYFPIRQPCVSGSDISSTLAAACAAATQTETAPGSGIPVPVVVTPYTDASGRLLCDPHGQTRRQQITEVMNLIFSTPNHVPNRIGARADFLQGSVVSSGG